MANIETVLKQIGKRGQRWGLGTETGVTEVDSTLSLDQLGKESTQKFTSFKHAAILRVTPQPTQEGYGLRFEVVIPPQTAASPGDTITRLKFQLRVAEFVKGLEGEFAGRVYTP